MKSHACPFCGSADIDSAARTCRGCGTGLPDGSFDPNRRLSIGRATMKRTVAGFRSHAIENGLAKKADKNA